MLIQRVNLLDIGEEDTEQEEEGEGEEEEGEDALYAGDSLNIEPELNTLPGNQYIYIYI